MSVHPSVFARLFKANTVLLRIVLAFQLVRALIKRPWPRGCVLVGKMTWDTWSAVNDLPSAWRNGRLGRRRRRRHRVVVEDRSVAPVWPRRMASRHRSAGGRWWFLYVVGQSSGCEDDQSYGPNRGQVVYRLMPRPVVSVLGELECWVTFSPRAQRWLHVVSWCSPSQGAGLYAQRPCHCEREPAGECGESAVDTSCGRHLVS